jgi:hypothetical protein
MNKGQGSPTPIIRGQAGMQLGKSGSFQPEPFFIARRMLTDKDNHRTNVHF